MGVEPAAGEGGTKIFMLRGPGELVARAGVKRSEDARNPHIPASAAPVSCEKHTGAGAAKFFLLPRSILVWRCVMPVEPQPVPNESSGFLKGCLVDGDAEQQMRERHVRRRALVISVALQGAALATLILVPLFGKPARIAFASYIPLPPYHHSSGATRVEASHEQQRRFMRTVCVTCPLLRPSAPTSRFSADPPTEPLPPGTPTGPGADAPCPGCVNIDRTESGPQPPSDAPTRTERVHMTHLDPAMLIHRVEPVYPTLPRQLGRGGRVELRAIIATDGTIQSLQVVGGDFLFYQSALDAVRQWRYTPTVLNGQPVEIDTYISVIYTMQR
jgi:protein TonB